MHTRYPIKDLHNLLLVVVAGDSVAGGDKALGGNLVGGRGFARMLLTNHLSIPSYEGHDLKTLYPQTRLVDASYKGATSTQALRRLYNHIAMSILPDEEEGDVILLIHVGGRDFFGNVEVMIDPEKTQIAANELCSNLAKIFSVLHARYSKSDKVMITLVNNIIDPSDGTGMISDIFVNSLCASFRDPRVVVNPDVVMANLRLMNQAIADEVSKRAINLVDVNAGFVGHGMTAMDMDRWIDLDCFSLTDEGHHQLRRLVWAKLTGEVY